MSDPDETPTWPSAVTVTEPEQLQALYDSMLVPNFPAEELISRDELLGGVAEGWSVVHAVGDPDDPLAIAVIECLEDTDAVLLAYFATRADQRGKGVGTALLRELLHATALDPDISVVLAEVEHPAHHEPDEAHGDPTARLRFYGRLGGRILDFPYFQPAISDGAEPVYGMLLLVLEPPDRFVVDGRLLPSAGAGGALRAIYAATSLQPAQAARIAEITERGVRLIPVEQLDQAPVSLPDQR